MAFKVCACLVAAFVLMGGDCMLQPVDFCVQYYNANELQITPQAVDGRNMTIHSGFSLDPPPPPPGIQNATQVFVLNGQPPITYSAAFQIEGTCVFPITGVFGQINLSDVRGRIFRVEFTPFGTIECVDEGPCDQLAARPSLDDWFLP